LHVKYFPSCENIRPNARVWFPTGGKKREREREKKRNKKWGKKKEIGRNIRSLVCISSERREIAQSADARLRIARAFAVPTIVLTRDVPLRKHFIAQTARRSMAGRD